MGENFDHQRLGLFKFFLEIAWFSQFWWVFLYLRQRPKTSLVFVNSYEFRSRMRKLGRFNAQSVFCISQYITSYEQKLKKLQYLHSLSE